FGGNCHGKDLCILDKKRAYLEPSQVVYDTVLYFLKNEAYVDKIKGSFKPSMTKEEYLAYLK
ncbi:MAG: hypothetical protein VZR26_01935, partial [Erysipelotrichaceae bacterium]|nr:hypothetical protein [Erysipelotrichaceae bacterium]